MLNEVKAELKSFYFVEGCATPMKLQKLRIVRAFASRGGVSELKTNPNFMPKGQLKLHFAA